MSNRHESDGGAESPPMNHDLLLELLALEHVALTRWCAGDPGGFLEISAPEVVYFDPFVERRIDGIAALTAYYEALHGKIRADRFEILHPVVNAVANMAVLSFHFVSFVRDHAAPKWNCTEVYRLDASRWRIVQSHWSMTNAGGQDG